MSDVAGRSHPVCRHCGHLRVSHARSVDGRPLGRCVKLITSYVPIPGEGPATFVGTCGCPGFESIDEEDR